MHDWFGAGARSMLAATALFALGGVAAAEAPATAVAPAAAVSLTEPPFRTQPPFVTENDAQLATAVEALTTFKTELNPTLWNADGTVRPEVRERLIAIVGTMFERLKLANKQIAVVDIDLSGSNISHEWDKDADLDVHVFLSTTRDRSVYAEKAEDLDRLLSMYNSLLKLEQEGQLTFSGTNVEFLFRGVRYKGEQDEGGSPHFALWSSDPARDNRWIVRPQLADNNFDRAVILAKVKEFTAKYNGLMNAYFADKAAFRCDDFIDFRNDMRVYRSGELASSGQRSNGNLVYRLMHRLSQDVQEETDDMFRECTNIKWSIR